MTTDVRTNKTGSSPDAREPPASSERVTAAPPRDLRGKRLGRYEILAQLASGGMATVYVARTQGFAGFERLFAIKVLHPHLAQDAELVAMFLDEARVAARIRHPNVVPTLDISDSENDGYFLVMEYVEGDSLAAVLGARVERVPALVAVRIAIDALEGLAAAHALTDEEGAPFGLVHRDISPHNILVGTDGVARIADFGIAKARSRLSSTRPGRFKGKLPYAAPEQVSRGSADQRSDLFSLGVVLWEALCGRRLFRGGTDRELVNQLLHAEIPPLSDAAPELGPLDGVMARALAREPSERFQSAGDLLDAIEAAMPMVGEIAGARMVGKVVRERLGAKLVEQDVARPKGGPSPPASGSGPRPRPARREDRAAASVGPPDPRTRAELDIATQRYPEIGADAAGDACAPPYELLAMARRTPRGIEWPPRIVVAERAARGSLAAQPQREARASEGPARPASGGHGPLDVIELDPPFDLAPFDLSPSVTTLARRAAPTRSRALFRAVGSGTRIEPSTSDRRTELDLDAVPSACPSEREPAPHVQSRGRTSTSWGRGRWSRALVLVGVIAVASIALGCAILAAY